MEEVTITLDKQFAWQCGAELMHVITYMQNHGVTGHTIETLDKLKEALSKALSPPVDKD